MFNSEYSGHETKLVQQIYEMFPDEDLRFYACGGSGTFRKMLAGFPCGKFPEVAMFACGTTNDFLKSLDSQEGFDNLEALVTGTPKYYDYIQTDEGPIHNILAMGIEVFSVNTAKFISSLLMQEGSLAYSIGIIAALLIAPKLKLDIQIDGVDYSEEDIKKYAQIVQCKELKVSSQTGHNLVLNYDGDLVSTKTVNVKIVENGMPLVIPNIQENVRDNEAEEKAEKKVEKKKWPVGSVYLWGSMILSIIVLCATKNIFFFVACIGLASLVSLLYKNFDVCRRNIMGIAVTMIIGWILFGVMGMQAKVIDNESLEEAVRAEREKVVNISMQTILSICNAVDAKDAYTQEHSKRVSQYSAIIAEKLGWNPYHIEQLKQIALLHDIGKIVVSDNILNKPAKLTPEEYGKMKEHTVMGGEILKDLSLLPNVALGARYHHERYDGKGYPNGIAGKDIPIEARIIGIADAFDAMNSNRVYRKSLTSEKIYEELVSCSGTQFDPQILDVFLPIAREILGLSKDYKANI